MKIISLSLVGVAFLFSATVKADNIHKVTTEETAWFISQLYYGDGSKYPEILQANGLEKPGQLVTGMELVIPLPKYSNKDAKYQERYQHLKTARSKKLAEKKLAQNPTESQMVVVPSAELQKTNQDVPLTVVKPIESPMQKAQDELRRAAAQE